MLYHQDSILRYLTPFQRKLLQKSLQDNLSESYRQRIEIMLLADEGKTQTKICEILQCCPATVRHWMHIARTGMAHQWQDCPIGRPSLVSEAYLESLQDLLNHSPRNYGYGFKRWTISWLRKHLAKELGIDVSERHLKRILKQLGLSTISKPNHSMDEENNRSKIHIYDLKPENLALNVKN